MHSLMQSRLKIKVGILGPIQLGQALSIAICGSLTLTQRGQPVILNWLTTGHGGPQLPIFRF